PPQAFMDGAGIGKSGAVASDVGGRLFELQLQITEVGSALQQHLRLDAIGAERRNWLERAENASTQIAALGERKAEAEA
ncbi:hypothetical protein, partial [Mesorhizobium sp.]|uniref:hypothetical protein n=1 Tax=Mesorhizobium sp. TaxID=1871066 RepID=UPI0025C25D6D